MSGGSPCRMPAAHAQRGMVLAEWTLAALVGVLLVAAAMAWLRSGLHMALWQRVPVQMSTQAVWLQARLARPALLAGMGGVHPAGLDDERLSAWWPVADGPGLMTSDRLLLQRVLDTDALDCEGTRVGAGHRLVERYFLRTDSSGEGWVLACDAGSCDAGGCQRLGDAGVALHGHVDGLLVRYGLHHEHTGTLAYVDAAGLRQAGAGAALVAVRVGLLLRSGERLPAVARWRPPPDWPDALPVMPADRHRRDAWQFTLEVPHGRQP